MTDTDKLREAAEYILDGMGIDGPDYTVDPDDEYLDAANSKWVKETLSRLAAGLAAAPQPAPVDREALVEEIAQIIDHPSVYMGGPSRNALRTANAIADALLARGLRLPGGGELAAAYRAGQTDMKAAAMIAARDVGRSGGTSGDAVAAISRLPIRVVEAGDDE